MHQKLRPLHHFNMTIRLMKEILLWMNGGGHFGKKLLIGVLILDTLHQQIMEQPPLQPPPPKMGEWKNNHLIQSHTSRCQISLLSRISLRRALMRFCICILCVNNLIPFLSRSSSKHQDPVFLPHFEHVIGFHPIPHGTPIKFAQSREILPDPYESFHPFVFNTVY